MELNASDFLNAFANIDESQKLIKETVRKFVQDKFLPNVTNNFEQGHFPKELIAELGKLGLLGCNLSGYGCAGLDEVSYGLIMKELERGDSGLRSFASVQSSLAMYAIHAFGSEEQKNTFLPRMAKGERIGCFGLTEPDFGSNPAGMKTYAKKDGEDWIINGSKTWITNAPIADIAVVWAQTDDGIRGFLVEKETKGFSTPEIKHKLSLRASITGSLFFDQCRIPQRNILEKTVGLKNALMCLNQARFGIVFGVLGAAEDCLQEVIQYTKDRIMFKKPLAGYQLIQRKLAIMATEIAKGNLLAMQLAHLKHTKTLHPAQISMGKQNNVQIALECARTARDILGANGISGEYRSMRHMCNLESVSTYEGTNDIHLLIVGEKLTGLSAFE
ncbi:acyl-CoA dehydrogenase family protein [Pigmentibacter sp. JX0631]|uniref:acyl-CoA dehydrogenase family protein n=1 Tax=Pigmentibacter sp. JX0631 TaxID=2976982 RepID=UPI0024682FDA|nr:acyl-CoA dehydrogenase family protein [Pigmentibacter sp. JX0631]WGL59081.1 acyl-CoA dehydrogenase family protein [Pigmentibacter sp. JX0631]